MVKWIVVAVIVVGLLLGVLAVVSVLSRLSALQRAARRLQLRLEQLAGVQAKAAVLQESVMGLQQRAAHAQEQLAVIRAGRGARDG